MAASAGMRGGVGMGVKYFLIFLVLACVGAFVYDKYARHAATLPTALAEPATATSAAPAPSTTPEWRPPPRGDTATVANAAPVCDGRTHCSQMRSCADAKAHLQCPGASMDGDGDGIPCENQWCSL